MASHTISGQRWPDGTTVNVYPATAQTNGGQPAGAAVTNATVTAGAVTFSGLSLGMPYVAYAAGTAVRVMVPKHSPADSLRARVDELEVGKSQDVTGLTARVEDLETTTAATSSELDAVQSDVAGLQSAVGSLTSGSIPAGQPDSGAIVQSQITAMGAAGGTIYLGRGTHAWGTIPKIPVDKPVTILGAGVAQTKIVLSRAAPRFLDLDCETAGQTFRNITLSGFTVDANNISHLTMAPATAVTSNVTLAGGFAWTAVQLSSSSNFQLSEGLAWALPGNAGTAKSVQMRYRPVAGNPTNIELRGGAASLTLVAGDQISGAFNDHVLFGNQHGNYLSQSAGGAEINMHLRDVLIEDVDVLNVPRTEVASLSSPTPSLRHIIGVNNTAAGGTIQNFTVRRLRANSGGGGDSGVWVVGADGTWIDNVVMEDCSHDCGATPTQNYPSLNYMVGQGAWVGSVAFRGCKGRNSGDVGIEVDQAMASDVDEECLIEDAFSSAYYGTNFAPPARSINGPPTTTVQTGGGITSGSTSVTTAAIPSGADQSGYAKIESELVYYAVSGATSMSLRRGINGSTAAAHAQGVTVTFMENRKQHWQWRGKSRRVLSASGRGWSGYTNSFLPFPDMDFDGVHERINDIGQQGEAINLDGLCSNLRIGNNFKALLDGNTGQSVTVIHLNRSGATSSTAPSEVEPDVVKIGRALLRAGGTATAGALHYLRFDGGYWDVEVSGLRIVNGLRGLTGVVRGISAGSVPSALRATIDMSVSSQQSADNAMSAINIGGSAVLGRLDIENLDLYHMTTSSASYMPWIVPSGSQHTVTVHRVVHPFALTSSPTGATFPKREVAKWTTAKIAAYTATHDDDVVPCDTAGAAAGFTVTLPLLAGGHASTNPKPGDGARITVLDVSASAATKNITVQANAADKLFGVTAGTTVINTNSGKVTLIGHNTLGWWTL